MRSRSYRTARAALVGMLAAVIGGIGHATTMGHVMPFDVVALLALGNALLLTFAPLRRLGVPMLIAALALNQLAVHHISMWRLHAQHAADAMHLHVHASLDPSPIRMLIVHAIALFVGVLVLRHADHAVWRLASRTVATIVARVRRIATDFSATPSPALDSARAVVLHWCSHRIRIDQWSRLVTGRRGPPLRRAAVTAH